MNPAAFYVSFAGVAFVLWMALGSRWLIWVFVFATLVLAIDAVHPGVGNTSILPIAQNFGGY